jgi:hypothetical protein
MENQYLEDREDADNAEGESCKCPEDGEDEDNMEGCQMVQKESEVFNPTDYQMAMSYMETIASNNGERKGKQLIHDTDFKRGSNRIAMRCRNKECLFRIVVRRNRKSSSYYVDDDLTDARHFSKDTHGLDIPCINRSKASVVRAYISCEVLLN